MAYERDNLMTCEEAQVVSFMYMKDDPSLTAQRRGEFEAHLLVCSTCDSEFEENKSLMGLLRKYWPISEDTKQLLLAAGYDAEAPHASRATSDEPYRPMTIEESWEDLKRRCPSLAEACRRDERKRKLNKLVWRTGSIAAAACILLALGIGWLMMRNGNSSQQASSIVANPNETPAAVNDANTSVIVSAGQTSATVGHSPPSTPHETDAHAATASDRQADVNVDLSAISQSLWRQPAPPDVDTLDYATWRDEHRQHNLALSALAAMPKDQAAKTDWIESSMVSGNIWQFNYDSKLANQPFAKPEPQAIARLARHYELDEREMLRNASLPDSAPLATSPVQDLAPGRRYADALRRWHDALTATGQNKPDSNDLKAFSLFASQYLAETRTAAYLWAKTHPQEVRQLLADSTYAAMLPMVPSTSKADEWTRQLRQQAVDARNSVPAAMEWLLAPSATSCSPEPSEQQRKLAALVGELAPALLDQREGQEQ